MPCRDHPCAIILWWYWLAVEKNEPGLSLAEAYKTWMDDGWMMVFVWCGRCCVLLDMPVWFSWGARWTLAEQKRWWESVPPAVDKWSCCLVFIYFNSLLLVLPSEQAWSDDDGWWRWCCWLCFGSALAVFIGFWPLLVTAGVSTYVRTHSPITEKGKHYECVDFDKNI